MQHSFDIIVVGGGHAGTEAAFAAGRMGLRTLLVTHSIETIGFMSCNPAIGGIGKGHLVKEISAMGGIMPKAADQAAIHVRILNGSKGPAVRATRTQADRDLYRRAVRQELESCTNVHLFQQPVDDLLLKDDQIIGVQTQLGIRLYAKAVVLTTGTFLSGKIHVGDKTHAGGRAGASAAQSLSSFLRSHPQIRYGRLKTGTPARIDLASIDTSKLDKQPSEYPSTPFDFWENYTYPQQVDCYITHTNEKTHKIIQDNLHLSAMFSGNIEGPGPRYCPSVEDKIHRFAHQNKHQIFIEPEGLETREVYPNGISTSLPYAIQQRFIRTIKGLENAHITRPGYAIEYDYFDPRDLTPWLASKWIENLFFAGQINGTTGYEEAAAQGLLAGINAALMVQNKPQWYPKRHEAYIGVLVDDLNQQGAQEPYRMFTSRAEHRLLLREDNADTRLTEKAYELGLLTSKQWKQWSEKYQNIQNYTLTLKDHVIHPGDSASIYLDEQVGIKIQTATHGHELIKRPEISTTAIQTILPDTFTDTKALEQVIIQAKYAGYIVRQKQEVEKKSKQSTTVIPKDFDYSLVQGLSNEVLEKLEQARPHTIGQAERIGGVTPAAISLLMVYIKRYQPIERVAT